MEGLWLVLPLFAVVVAVVVLYAMDRQVDRWLDEQDEMDLDWLEDFDAEWRWPK